MKNNIINSVSSKSSDSYFHISPKIISKSTFPQGSFYIAKCGMDRAETNDVLQYSRQGSNGMDLIEKLSLNVLDLGCGTGFLASVIAKRIGESGKVTAVDPDKDM